MRNVKEWWNEAIHKQGQSKKAMASLAMLVSWEIWKERNARVFRNNASTLSMLVTKIKDEAVIWSLAGAKALSVNYNTARVGLCFGLHLVSSLGL
jgi:predicted negative regulator of RcsB-dependent stress response